MATSRLYFVGRFVGRNKAATLGALAAAAYALWLYNFFTSEPTPPPAAIVPKQNIIPLPVPPSAVAIKAKCAANMERLIAEANEHIKKKEAAIAVNVLYECRDHFPDPKGRALYVKAGDIVSIEAVKQAEKDALALKKQKKKEGVTIGMDQQDVLDSSWGRPTKINRTTTATRVSEQWVYPGGYLYFDDGVLRSIQN